MAAVFWALITAAVPVAASPVTFSGDTTGAPTFQRPVEDLSALSVIGTLAHYNAYAFTASSSGVYGFTTSGAFDTFAILYDGAFQPAAGLLNALIANDDLTNASFTVSGFDYLLLAGHTYTYVVTGFDNDEFGRYTTTIVSPVATGVPEPASWALVALGTIAAIRRRRVPRAGIAAGATT